MGTKIYKIILVVIVFFIVVLGVLSILPGLIKVNNGSMSTIYKTHYIKVISNAIPIKFNTKQDSMVISTTFGKFKIIKKKLLNKNNETLTSLKENSTIVIDDKKNIIKVNGIKLGKIKSDFDTLKK